MLVLTSYICISNSGCWAPKGLFDMDWGAPIPHQYQFARHQRLWHSYCHCRLKENNKLHSFTHTSLINYIYLHAHYSMSPCAPCIITSFIELGWACMKLSANCKYMHTVNLFSVDSLMFGSSQPTSSTHNALDEQHSQSSCHNTTNDKANYSGTAHISVCRAAAVCSFDFSSR